MNMYLQLFYNRFIKMERRVQKRPRVTKYPRYRNTRLNRTLGRFPLSIRISYTWKLNGNVAGGCTEVGALTGFLQSSNDWASCKGLYASYKINKVLVQYLPNLGGQLGTVNDITALGIAYDHSNQTPLTNINQIADYENYIFAFPGSNTNSEKTLKFKIRAIGTAGPYNTNDATEYAGWLKMFMEDNAEYAAATICGLIIQFYVVFSGVQ